MGVECNQVALIGTNIVSHYKMGHWSPGDINIYIYLYEYVYVYIHTVPLKGEAPYISGLYRTKETSARTLFRGKKGPKNSNNPSITSLTSI